VDIDFVPYSRIEIGAHDCRLLILTLCLTVALKLELFGDLSLGGATFGDQQHVFIMRGYAEACSFVVSPHVS
jgi:hypothetical protein